MPTIVTKNSSTSGTAPTAGQLTKGELAVNVTDRILFTEDGSGNVVTLGRPINIQESPSAGTGFTWTKVPQASWVFVELIGGGGGGGSGSAGATGRGGSGGVGGRCNGIGIIFIR